MTREHWDAPYEAQAYEETGWFEAEPTVSLELIEECRVAPSEAVVDVGCGESFLVDRLLERGFKSLVLADISQVALDEV